MSEALDEDTADAARASLARMGLARAGEAVSLTPLAGGVSSLILRADTRSGPVCYKRALARLRVASDWRAPVERSLAELAWLRFAADVLPGVAPRILGEDREGLAFAMDFLDPEAHPVWKAELRDGRIDPDFAAAVGARLGALHAASARAPGLAARFANDAQFHALRLEPYFEASAARHPGLAPRLRALVDLVRGQRSALMHGDVSPKNILAGPDGPVLLDAECACWGDPAFDLAFCLNHLLLKCLWRPWWRERYLDCFDRLAAAYRRDIDWEAPAALEARAARLLCGMLLARVDGRSPVEYLVRETDRARVRGVAIALLAAPPDTLDGVVAVWRETTGGEAALAPDRIRNQENA